MTYNLPRGTPESQGLASRAVTAFLDEADSIGLELHSLMLLRHGHVVAEGWWSPYTPDGVQLLYSLSKSFTATAIGLAQHEGLLSLDDTVLGFFPERAPRDPHPYLASMRVRHLLSMATGHVGDTLEPIARRYASDWLGGFLALPPEQEPGSIFAYNNGATFMLAAILQRVTGMGLLEYLKPRLLEPLGITAARWDKTPQGLEHGFSGLHTTTEAVAKLGQLYLQRGRWDGQQLLPEAWVEDATQLHIANAPLTAAPNDAPSDWAQGYGFQFWMCRHGAYRGDGAFGQFCLVMPAEDAVLALTSATMDMQIVLDLAWKHLLPALQAQSGPLPEDTENQQDLPERLARLALPTVAGARSSPTETTVIGQAYRLELLAQPDDADGALYRPLPELSGLRLETTSAGWALELHQGQKSFVLDCGYESWLPASPGFLDIYPGPVRTSAAWTADDSLTLKLLYLETPHTLTLNLKFVGDSVRLKPRWNVQFGALELPPLTGTRR